MKNPINWLKNQLKSYLIRYHNYPTENYITPFSMNLEKDIVNIIEQIIGYGIVFYLFLFGLVKIFPFLNIKLGNSISGSFIILLFVGLIATTIRQIIGGVR